MKRARSPTSITNTINILYFDDLVIYMCQFYTLKELIKLESLSWYHLKLIRSTPLHQEFKPMHHISYLHMIDMIKNHEFKNINLFGTFLHNKNMIDLKNPILLDISNTFVNEKGLNQLKGPYQKLVLPREVLKYVFYHDNHPIDHIIDIKPPFNHHKHLINAISSAGNTVLIEALAYYNICDAFIKYMIESGVDVNVKNNNDKTALHYAIERSTIHSQHSSIQILLDYGAIVEEADIKNSMTKHTNITELLCYHFNDFKCECSDFNLPPQCLLSLSIYHKLDRVATYIAKNINLKTNKCVLRMAVYMENLIIFKLLLQYGANPLLSDSVLLINAINKNNYPIINLLSKYDMNIQNIKGRTAMMYACIKHDIKMVKHLASLGATTTLKDKYGWHLLSLYLRQDHCVLEDVAYLMTICDVNEVDNQWVNALMIAIVKGHHAIILYLINHSHINTVNCINQNALTIALEQYQNLEIIKALVDKGINLFNQSCPMFINALYFNCSSIIIDYLLDLNIDDVFYNGDHALIYMIRKNYNIDIFNKMIIKYQNRKDLLKHAYDLCYQCQLKDFCDLIINLDII